MYNIQNIILENEVHWLKSINIEIFDDNGGIKAKSCKNKTSDFNFYIPNKNVDLNSCNRISDRGKKYYEYQKQLFENRMLPENVFDINFITLGNGNENMQNSDYQIIEVNYEIWEIGTRNINERTKYYSIEYEGNSIGKMSIVETDFLIGIYDFEIFKSFQNKKHASNFLKLYTEMIDKYIFIQTWSTNIYAIRAYLSAGFNIFENLYRYNI